jgi:hypothetical protein
MILIFELWWGFERRVGAARLSAGWRRAASTDVKLAEQLLRVNNLVDPPTRLQGRALLPRIIVGKLRRPVNIR